MSACREDIKAAVEAVRGGKSIRWAAKQHKVAKTTIHRHMKGQIKRVGRPTALGEEKEALLVAYVIKMSSIGFGLSKDMVLALASQMTGGRRFNKTWWKRFRRRHSSEIKLQRPESLEQGRAKNTTEEAIDGWFSLLETTYQRRSVTSGAQIWNVDEKGFVLDPLPRRVVCGRQQRHPYQQHRRTNDHITVNVCVNAAGQFIPPQVIYSRSQLRAPLVEGGPENALYGHSPKGSMTADLFIDWFSKLFLPNTRRDVHQVIIMDNHASHYSIQLIEIARDSNVSIVCLPSKTTHVSQPLDRIVFGSLKSNYDKTAAASRLVKQGYTLTLADFPKILKKALEESLTPTNIVSGFRVTGVWPLDKTRVPEEGKAPSKVYEASTSQGNESDSSNSDGDSSSDGSTSSDSDRSDEDDENVSDRHGREDHAANSTTADQAISEQRRQLYLKRLQEGYDLPDPDYEKWRDAHQARTAQQESRQPQPLLATFVRAGIVSEEMGQLLALPRVAAKSRSAASNARTLTSDEFHAELKKKEDEKKKMEEEKKMKKTERENRKQERRAAEEKRREEIEKRKKGREEAKKKREEEKKKRDEEKKRREEEKKKQEEEKRANGKKQPKLQTCSICKRQGEASEAGSLWIKCPRCKTNAHLSCWTSRADKESLDTCVFCK